MSIWKNINQRSEGTRKRKENEFLSQYEIAEYLKSITIGQFGSSPVKMFYITVKNFNSENSISIYSICLTASQTHNGDRTFCTKSNIDRICNINGGILKIQ